MANNEIVLTPTAALVPDRLFAPTAKAAARVLEFFTAQINNDNTRSAYLIATKRFTLWCEDHSIRELTEVRPFHVAAFIKDLQKQLAPPR
jgi:hypothetical protein